MAIILNGKEVAKKIKEDEQIDAEHVECRHTCHSAHPQSPAQTALVGGDKDFVLAPEAGKGRNARNGQTANQEGDARDGHELVQTVHVAVLVAVNSMNNSTGTQEQQCFEHCVCKQVEH